MSEARTYLLREQEKKAYDARLSRNVVATLDEAISRPIRGEPESVTPPTPPREALKPRKLPSRPKPSAPAPVPLPPPPTGRGGGRESVRFSR